MAENKIKPSTIFDGIIIPLILVLLIYVLAVYVNVGGQYHVLGQDVIGVILTNGFAQMIVMGGMYYVASAGQYNGLFAASGVTGYNYFGDISMLFYLVNAVIIGYMAGAINNGSSNFKRMLLAGLTAALITAVIQAYLNATVALEFGRQMALDQWASDPLMAIVTGFVPSIALGVIVPILAKVMTWYGLQPQKHAGY